MNTVLGKFKSATLGAIMAVLVVSLVVLPTVGCTSQQTIAALTQTLGTSAASIATLEGNTALASQLTKDTAAAVAAITAWKNGSTATVVIESLNIVEADLNLIPGTSQYAPLIDIAIATVQSILALLPPPATPVVGASRVPFRTVSIGHPAPTSAKQFKTQWNGYIATHSNLSAATIK